MKTIKAGTVPGMLREYSVEQNATIADILSMAEIDLSGRTVMLDGASVATDTVPADGSTVTVTQKIKGNA